ncbi:MAG: hypothetical protein EZS28_011418 [Streblomastix strix]|uniref:Uncharacterized protein n=1 Tax=Streblomastix strix TaxID=222440 RepID=A0A5J4WDP9_9EUKA|nr:MAG: hypothetical protein EZS28_011418 [Streblomastix strix]
MEQKIHYRTNSSYERAGKDYRKASIPQNIISSNSSTNEASLQDINTRNKTIRLVLLSKAESQNQTRLELKLITDQEKRSPTFSDNSNLSNSNNRRIQTRMGCIISDNQSKYRDQQLKEKKIHSIHWKTDNTTTSFNINRKNSSRILSYLTDQALQLAESLQIQQKATYIPGIENQTADVLSRQNRAGDYHLKKRIEEQIWKAEQPVILPPILLIGHCLQRIKQEKVVAIMIVTNWEGQYWWPLIQQMTIMQNNLGQSSQILKNGPIATRRRLALPPGELLAILDSYKNKEDQEKNCIDKQ